MAVMCLMPHRRTKPCFLPGATRCCCSSRRSGANVTGSRGGLGPLASNPFPDARPKFFASLETTLALSNPVPLRILRPFGELHKIDVMRLGREFPLQHTWSCIAPGATFARTNSTAANATNARNANTPLPMPEWTIRLFTLNSHSQTHKPACFALLVKSTFCYGHRLLNYDGKCKHLHGHNGRVIISLEAPTLDNRGDGARL